MNTSSDTIGALSAALAKAQGDFRPAAIDGEAKIATKTGSGYGYTYASLTSVWEAIRKPLSDNALSVIQRIDDEEGAIFLYTILSHSSGEYIVSRFYVCQIGRPAQETGSALTYARRYALSALVGVVTDEDDDGQEATKKHQERKAQHAPAPAHVGASGERVDEDGFQVWADWRNQSDAKAWAMALQPVRFNAQRHCDNAYDKVKEDCNPRTAQEMWKCWYRYVMAHAPAKGAVITDAELDGEEVPLFN